MEIIRELDPDDAKLEIPWASATDPGLHYVDLKAFPERIAQLEESRQHPPLADLLRKINAAGTSFRTAKCDVWTTTELTEDERLDFRLPFKVGSYVDLLFARPELFARLEPHLQLADKLRQMLRPLRVQTQMEICLRHCLFHPEERWGYYLTIFIHAYGGTPAEAKEEWSRALAALGEALEGIGRPLRTALPEPV